MIVKVSKAFEKDLTKIKDQKLKRGGIHQLKKLKGHKEFYRIRLGQYRAGVAIVNDSIEFLVIDNRKDIYKRFP